LGPYPAVAIYDYNVAKELFSREELTGRPDNFVYRFRTLGKRQGIFKAKQQLHDFELAIKLLQL
jgi:hypothetical protein